MKQNLAILRRFILFLVTFGLIFSCAQEEEFIKYGNQSQQKIFKIISFKDLLKEKEFNTAYNRIILERQKGITSKTALEDEYNFEIVEGKDAKIIEFGNKKYYNILIKRDVKNESFFENLVIYIDNSINDDDLKLFIAKYNILAGQAFYNPTETDVELTIISSRVTLYCYNVCVSYCTTGGEEPHPCYGPDCRPEFDVCTEMCRETFAGTNFGYTGNGTEGNNSSNTEGNNSSNYVGGGHNPNTSNTTVTNTPQNQNSNTTNQPTLELLLDPVIEDELPTIDPCDELKDLLKTQNDTYTDSTGTYIIQRPKLAQKIISLRPNTNTKKENGIELKYDKATESYSHNYANLAGNLATNLTVALTVGTDYWGSIHSHPKNGLAIPSFLDLVWLKDCYSYTK